jgi:hypothetical protein
VNTQTRVKHKHLSMYCRNVLLVCQDSSLTAWARCSNHQAPDNYRHIDNPRITCLELHSEMAVLCSFITSWSYTERPTHLPPQPPPGPAAAAAHDPAASKGSSQTQQPSGTRPAAASLCIALLQACLQLAPPAAAALQ